MKKIFLLLFTAVILTSCDPSEIYPVVCKLDNIPWNAASAPAITGSYGLTFNAQNNDNSSIMSATLLDYAVVGTHTIDTTDNVFALFDNGTSYKVRQDRPGVLKITEYDSGSKKVKGEFSFTLFDLNSSDSIVVTDGKFNLKYQ